MPKNKKVVSDKPMEPPRTRAFMVVTYDDDKEIRKNLHKVRLWAEIRHDKCLDDIGEALKPHYHTVIYFSDAKTATAASLQVGLADKSNMLQHISSLRWGVRYLCHLDDPEKHQYPIELVSASFNTDRYLLPKTEKDAVEQFKAASLKEFISLSGCCSMSQLFDFAVENGMYSELRRGQALFRQMLQENRYFDSGRREAETYKKIEELVLNSASVYDQGGFDFEKNT